MKEERNMFNNPGTRIKNLAKTLFTVSVVLSIALPLLLLIGEVIDEDLIFVVPIFALIGIGASYISCLFLAAFGELVETNTQIKESNDEILKKLNEPKI